MTKTTSLFMLKWENNKSPFTRLRMDDMYNKQWSGGIGIQGTKFSEVGDVLL